MRILSFLLSIILFVACQSKQNNLALRALIPKPNLVKSTGDSFGITSSTKIFVSSSSTALLPVAEYLGSKLRPSTGFELKVIQASEKPASGIFFTMGNNASLGEEGYEIAIEEDLLTVTSYQPAGAFRAIQTIRQLLPPSVELSTPHEGPWQIPTGEIKDSPVYAYRGAMLDVARHFFSVEEVKRFIDLIAAYKINVLHLHLSDDQGWRIEIKSWPNLTEQGGKTEVGGGVGGFYTQEQYKEIVRYAQDQFIIIVPEIDMPGHINSALASYGELNGGTIVPAEGRMPAVASPNKILDGKTKPTQLYTGIEVGWSTLRLEKEATFRFVEDVIREVAAITPGPYFHIGGDEAHVTKKEDYIKFINRFQGIVKANGKKMMGWEEIAQAEIDNNAITQYWNLSKYPLAMMAIEKGSQLVFSPASKTYLDMSYDSTTKLGLHWAAYIEVDSAYSWSPLTVTDGIAKENILGIEAPLWTETISNMDEAEYMLFPRLPGYAEIGWSAESNRNWEEYRVRLGKLGPRFKALDINFYQSKKVPWVK
jgi:hexosaminidase